MPADLQLDWLRAFVAVVDAGSLSAAAPRLFRSPSAVSVQIAKLEAALGRPVLSRGPRHLDLTPAGAQLVGHARRILQAHHEALGELTGRELTGRVRVGVPDDYAARYFTPALRAFVSRHQAVAIELVCEQSTALVPKVQRDEIDIALVSRPNARLGSFLRDEPLVWVGAPRHEAWRRAPLPIAVYETGSLARREAVAALKRRRIAHRIVYDSASLAGQIAAVESGLAIAVLTQCSVPPGLLILGERQGLPPLGAMSVAALRSKASLGSPAADVMFEELVRSVPAS
jgi:DNA-binding transcriptional LysR family regulator